MVVVCIIGYSEVIRKLFGSYSKLYSLPFKYSSQGILYRVFFTGRGFATVTEIHAHVKRENTTQFPFDQAAS
jgi:hypothetical protein